MISHSIAQQQLHLATPFLRSSLSETEAGTWQQQQQRQNAE
jgi:hypothetical protein